MRTVFIALALALPACVDAPITEAHLAPDGQLRAGLHSSFSQSSFSQSSFSQSSFSQSSFSARPQVFSRQAVQVAAVLAAQAEGALEDAAEFSASAGAVHLHLRADSLMEPRPVTFVWTHADRREVEQGVLAPTTTLTLAASHPISPDSTGRWEVEVYAADAAGAAGELLFRREFLVL